ncbi:hypothetical protein MBLNU459_g7334t1 [Dothideomycetes sp. NU459]
MVSPDVQEYGLKPLAIIIVPIPFLLLSATAISLRVYVRGVMIRAFGWDDIILLAAFALFAADCGLFMSIGYTELTEGITSPSASGKLNALSIPGIALYLVEQILFKLSMAFFFLRIALERWQRLIILGSVGIYSVYLVIIIIIAPFQCGYGQHESCLKWDVVGPIIYISAVLNVIVDVILAFVPYAIIRTLQMPERERKSVYFLIALGTCAAVVSVARIPYVPGLRTDNQYYSAESDRIAYTSVAESGLGIVAASLATLRPLYRKIFGKLSTSRSASKNTPSTKPSSLPFRARPKTSASEEEFDLHLQPSKSSVDEAGKGINKTTFTSVEFEDGSEPEPGKASYSPIY